MIFARFFFLCHMKFFRHLLLVGLLLLPLGAFSAAEEPPLKNAGFVPANIWYSKDPFFSGDKIRIYTILFNGSLYDLTGVVEFYDNETLINSSDFSLAGSGRVRDVWVDWVPKEGKHVITARIVKTKITDRNGKKRDVVLENAKGGGDERMVDADTDGDGVGNKDDEDDDNDTVPDTTEVRYGLDPLKKDTDGNGTPDSKEIADLMVKPGAIKSGIASTTKLFNDAGRAIETASGSIPAPVRSAFSGVLSIGEAFRHEQGSRLAEEKEKKFKDIEVIEANELAQQVKRGEEGKVYVPDDLAQKPIAYVLFGLYALAEYFFTTKIIFYGFVLYVVYRMLRFIFWKIRSWRDR